MKSFQQRCLAKIEELATERGLECSQVTDWANTGTVLVHCKNSARVLGKIIYHFDAGHYALRIFVGQRPVQSQPPREGYFEFYQNIDAPTKFWSALERSLVEMKELVFKDMTDAR